MRLCRRRPQIGNTVGTGGIESATRNLVFNHRAIATFQFGSTYQQYLTPRREGFEQRDAVASRQFVASSEVEQAVQQPRTVPELMHDEEPPQASGFTRLF